MNPLHLFSGNKDEVRCPPFPTLQATSSPVPLLVAGPKSSTPTPLWAQQACAHPWLSCCLFHVELGFILGPAHVPNLSRAPGPAQCWDLGLPVPVQSPNRSSKTLSGTNTVKRHRCSGDAGWDELGQWDSRTSPPSTVPGSRKASQPFHLVRLSS